MIAAREIDGAAFVLDAPVAVAAVWGRGSEVVWSRDESLFVTGPTGVGKTTLVGQLVEGRLGLSTEFLGYPIEPDERGVLYLALDRPSQIQRSMRRIFSEEHREVLRQRLTIHRGSTWNVAVNGDELVDYVLASERGTVIIDSLKDIAVPLTSDETGAAVTNTIARILEHGIQVVAIHHHRKASGDNKRPNHLADVYGSAWLTAGAGSVITLWGQAGDPLVDFLHLKPPADEVGPLELEHDHDHGRTIRRDKLDEHEALRRAGETGITAAEVAEAIQGGKPSRAQVEKARRRLDKLVEKGDATVTAGDVRTPSVYTAVKAREGDREGPGGFTQTFTDLHESPQTQITHPHAADHDEGTFTHPLKERGAREGSDAGEDDPHDALIAEHEALDRVDHPDRPIASNGHGNPADTRAAVQRAVTQ